MFGKKIKSIEQDPYLLERVQARGGITFRDERVVLTGTGYETCIHVYRMPHEVENHWMLDVTRFDDSIVTIDMHTEDIYEVRKNLNKSISEQQSRYKYAQNAEEEIDAETKAIEMRRLLAELSNMHEVVKAVHIRIFTYAKTLEDLDRRVKHITNELESNNGYVPAVLLNEQRSEWLSMWRPYGAQAAQPFCVNALSLTSETLAAGYPFHFSSLEDKCGDYLGYTPCDGSVLFDLFAKTADRTYYNAMALGNMGYGKSTLLKKQFKSRAIRGDYIRTFDISGEFTSLTRALGGKIITLDGRSGMLNPLEILASGDDEVINFTRHLSKLKTEYRFLAPESPVSEADAFQNNLRDFYESLGMRPTRRNNVRVTHLKADAYPTFSDFLGFVNKKINAITETEYKSSLEEEAAKRELLMIMGVRDTVGKIVNTYGPMFDGHTSIDNIVEEQIVTFDLSLLKDMEANIFDAEIFNMISLCWDNGVQNGSLMKSMWENDEIEWEDITRFLIIIDEAHRWLNAGKMQAVEQLLLYLREGRKYFCGILLASQSIRDFVPEGTSDEKVEKLKTVFELTQYKFVFKQDSNLTGLLNKTFDNVLTDSQIRQIPRLEMGNCMLVISADQTLKFKVYLSKREEKLFAGGA